MFTRTRRLLAGAGVLAITGAGWAGITGVASAAQKPADSGNLFASVAQDGTLVAGPAGTSVTHLGTGQYEVTFGQDVSGCAYVATTVNAYSQALQATTAGGHLSQDGVYVETKNQGGGLTDGPFNLAVDCGQPGWSYAVVGYDGNLVRSTPGATLTALSAGRYDVTFPSPVKNCAYLATVGDPGNSLVYSPAGVYTGSSSDPDTVYVETKNPGGGLSSGVPFHLAVICPGAASTHDVVVNANGLTTRQGHMTTSFRSSTGQYTLVTNKSLAGCATVATRGSVSSAVPYDPATVEIVPGPASNTIGVQVRGLLESGGNLADEAFHAAAIC